MDTITKTIVANALNDFNNTNYSGKMKLIEKVENQLVRSKKAESIGFAFDPKMVEAAKIFLRIANYKLNNITQ